MKQEKMASCAVYQTIRVLEAYSLIHNIRAILQTVHPSWPLAKQTDTNKHMYKTKANSNVNENT